MTFLQIGQRLAMECGASITLSTMNPVGQPQEAQQFIAWVIDAWSDLQCDHDDWDWMRASNLLGSGVSFQTVNNTYSYPLGVGSGTVGVLELNFGKWVRPTFRCNTTSVGHRDEIPLGEVSYDAWRDTYMRGAQRDVRTRPIIYAVGPDQSICLGPPPNDDYTITGDYYTTPNPMINDSDTPPGLPLRFHMLIVYRGMLKYAGYESASEVYQRGKEEGDGMFAQLEAIRAPRVSFGRALA